MRSFAVVVCAVVGYSVEAGQAQHQHLRRAELSAKDLEVDDDEVREAQGEVKQAEQKLYANLHETREIKEKLAQADNKTGQLQEVEEHVKIVANETTSDSLANFLGDFWTEMHTFARPLYKDELKDQLEDLADDLPELEKNLDNAKAALADVYDEEKVEKATEKDEAEVEDDKEEEPEEEVKEEPKEEAKEEVEEGHKEEVMEEPKEDVKLDAKKELKEDVKLGVKEETKAKTAAPKKKEVDLWHTGTKVLIASMVGIVLFIVISFIVKRSEK